MESKIITDSSRTFLAIFWITLFTFFVKSVFAQSDFDLTQRHFNESIYNPAATGNSFTTGVFLHARTQWAGLDGAPNTQAASFDTYIERIRSAFGLSITGDQIGFASTYNGKLSYAFYLPISKKSTLAFGLSAAVLNRKKNANGALVDELDDPDLYYGNASEYSPDFDFGVEYKGALKIGMAIRHIGIRSNTSQFPELSKNFWAYASTRMNLGSISVEPTVSYMSRNKINRYEIGSIFYFLKTNNKFKFNDKFWAGILARFNNQFAVLAGVSITKSLRIGYSFDYGSGDLSAISKMGTHEFCLSWQFNPIFYREELCPAYKNSRYNTKGKKRLRNKVKYRF